MALIFAIKPPAERNSLPAWLHRFGWLSLLLLNACGVWENVPGPTSDAQQFFQVPEKRTTYSTTKALRAFESTIPTAYSLAPGDEITVDVAGWPQLSGKHLVGPDGRISLPQAGLVTVANLSRQDTAQRIAKALSQYYMDINVTVGVTRYGSNRIVVLGRVENPGFLQFDNPPTLLETLAQAGGLPLLRKEQLLTRCAVIRGDQILWIDLKRLLTGDLTLNVRLQRNDVVYIPDSFDTPVYVMGEVEKPGVYRLTPQMSFLDALGQAGGPTVNADPTHLHVIRPSAGVNLEFSIETLLKPDNTLNVGMEEGDIIYVPRNGVAKVGYILQNLNPFSNLITIQRFGGTSGNSGTGGTP